MPSVPGSRCAEPGCGDLAPFGQARCERHADELVRDYHAGAHRRVYQTDRWAATRMAVLRAHPVCQHCREATATQVDHVRPLRVVMAEGGDPYDQANLEALCHGCHSRKTAAEVGLGG